MVDTCSSTLSLTSIEINYFTLKTVYTILRNISGNTTKQCENECALYLKYALIVTAHL